jgi:amidase
MIRTRAVSPVEVLDAHLAAIARLNPRLNAIVTLAADAARDAARRAQAAVMEGAPLPPLHGLTFGSPLYRDFVPDEDDEVVARLKAAGAIVLAKTNTPEFAAGANTVNAVFGATRNPWNAALSPAGSSGGSAVAVATGMLPLAQGTDFGGSVRVPAAFCGIVGLRPTPGLVSNHPAPLAWDPGQVHGPLARSAEDAALMLDAMMGLSRFSPISAPPPWRSVLDIVERTHDAKGVRAAFVPDIAGIGVEPDIAAACRDAAMRLRDAGATVEEIAFDVSDGRDPYQVWRGAWMVGRQLENLPRLEELGDNLQANVKRGLGVTALDIAKAEAARIAVFHRFRALFERYDVLLTPAAPVRPFPVESNFPAAITGRKLDSYIDWIAATFLVTLVSLPACSVPAGLTADGLPVGLQIVAPRFEEPRILSLAKLVQQQNPIGWPPGT